MTISLLLSLFWQELCCSDVECSVWLCTCLKFSWETQISPVVLSCKSAKYCCDRFKLLSCLAVRICNSRSFPCVDEDSGSEEETLQYFSAVDPNYRSRRKKKLDSQNKNSQSFLSVLLSINHGLMAVFTDVKVRLHSLLQWSGVRWWWQWRAVFWDAR